MKYLFTVIIPIFNSENFISRCVDSILEQNHNSLEILLINDFSTDKSKLICNKYEVKYNFIKVIDNKRNYGVGISRNKGIKKSNGRYIIFIDSDDFLNKNSLKNLENNIKQKPNPDVIIVRFEKKTYPNSNLKLINRNLNNNNNVDKLINDLTKSKFPFADCWFAVTKRDFLIKNKIFFPEIRIGESELFIVKIVSFMKRYNLMRALFYKKIDRDSSLNLLNELGQTFSTLNLILDFCNFINTSRLSKIKKNFAMLYIQDALGIFTSSLIQRSLEDRKKIAITLSRKIDNFLILKKLPENLNLYDFIKNQKPLIGISNYIAKIEDIHFRSLKPMLSNYKYIFCYCRSKYSLSTINLLENYNIKISGIIDDSEEYKNTLFYNFKVLNLLDFFRNNRKIIKKCAIIISHQRSSTSSKIMKEIVDGGLSKKQIKVIKF